MAKKRNHYKDQVKQLDFQDVLRISWRHGYKASLTSGLEPAFFKTKAGREFMQKILESDAFDEEKAFALRLLPESWEVLRKIEKPDNYQELMNKAIKLGVLFELEEKFSTARLEITDQMDAFLAENEDEMLKLIFDDSGGAMAIERQKAIFNC